MSRLTKIYGKICQEIGANENKQFKIVSGVKDGYSFVVGVNGAYGNLLYVKFSLSKNRVRLMEETINDLKGLSDQIANISIPAFDVLITIKSKTSIDAQSNSIIDVINKSIEYFKTHEIENTDEITGEVIETFASNITGRIMLISKNTFANKAREVENVKDEKEENIPLGIVGAIAGSLLGVIVIIALGQIGFVASISGAIMGVATLIGYQKLGHKLDKKGIIISIAIMIIMTYLASRLNIAISVKREVPTTDLFEVFKNMPNLVKYGLVKSEAYYGNMALTYLFTALGAYSTIKKSAFAVTNERAVKKL